MTRDEVTAAFEKITRIPEFGFSCGDGWIPLLGIVARKIAAIPEQERKGFRVDQIKEKWGTLRFYYGFGKRRGFSEVSIVGDSSVNSTRIMAKGSNAKDVIASIVHAAELASYFICEACGEPGRIGRGEFYVEVLCNEHATEAKQIEREGGRNPHRHRP